MNLLSSIKKRIRIPGISAGEPKPSGEWPSRPSASRKSSFKIAGLLLVVFTLLILLFAMTYETGRGIDSNPIKSIKVLDSYSGKPIPGALVTIGDQVGKTDANGIFNIPNGAGKVAIRAYGYMRSEPLFPRQPNIKLIPFTPKAVYLSFYGVGDRGLRESSLQLIRETELNALVIDIKGDRGMIPYKSSVPLSSEVGAQKIITVKDIGGLIKSFKADGIYTIARIVTFKDNLLASKRPDWAIKNSSGEIWRDRENLAWLDPFQKEVWDYNINIAVEAARWGFDEIQFDYVRFPDTHGLHFSLPNTEENRIKAISEFLQEARKRLTPYNVFLAADIFGYTHWNLNDTEIGQKLEDLALYLDYLSPMLYPSGFQYGIPGYRDPVAYPHEIVYLSLKRAQERTQLSPIRFRPWLQSFRDYAFDRRAFTAKEIKDQIDAAEKFGTDGWMLWNPRNIYSAVGLQKESPIG